MRIVVFGDSFTAGSGVDDDQVWVKRLEIELKQAGIRASVLNFGVGRYGMGQAYLHWQELGRDYNPDLVLIAFQPENLDRNVNVFRPLYYKRVDVPFSKPRFVLQDDRLALYNVPTLPPAELKNVYSSFASHPLAAYEAHYESHEFVSQWWAARHSLSRQQIQSLWTNAK